MSYKVVPPKHMVEVTITLEEGLLLSANPLMKYIVECAIARAQALHPVILGHHLVEASHAHLTMVVEDPSDIAGFVERLKTETAHYINRMLGRKKRTIWCEDYFVAPILTLSSAMKKITYIYTNPAKDNLETTIENFPGLSSWEAWKSGRQKKFCPRIYRSIIPYLPEKFYPRHTYRRIVRELRARTKEKHVLTLKLDAWMECFGITSKEEQRKINDKIREMIRVEEEKFQELRKEKGHTVIGQAALAAAHLDLDYVPDRNGKKMWCICDDKDLRIRYIQWAKSLKQQAREVYERWRMGDYSVKYPPGVFPPAVPKVANMTKLAVCY